jgi:hypothetical protein
MTPRERPFSATIAGRRGAPPLDRAPCLFFRVIPFMNRRYFQRLRRAPEREAAAGQAGSRRVRAGSHCKVPDERILPQAGSASCEKCRSRHRAGEKGRNAHAPRGGAFPPGGCPEAPYRSGAPGGQSKLRKKHPAKRWLAFLSPANPSPTQQGRLCLRRPVPRARSGAPRIPCSTPANPSPSLPLSGEGVWNLSSLIREGPGVGSGEGVSNLPSLTREGQGVGSEESGPAGPGEGVVPTGKASVRASLASSACTHRNAGTVPAAAPRV